MTGSGVDFVCFLDAASVSGAAAAEPKQPQQQQQQQEWIRGSSVRGLTMGGPPDPGPRQILTNAAE